MQRRKLADALKPGQIYPVQLDGRLGEGAQAEVYRVQRFNGRFTAAVLKLYRVGPASPVGRHLVALVAYLQGCPELRTHSVLVLPQHVLIDADEGRVGCLMPLALGEPLTVDTYIRLYEHPQSLTTRLRVAARLAEAVAALHRHGVVHADLTEPNVLLEMSAAKPALLDVDGGGVLDSPLGPKYRIGLAPLVRGRPEPSFLAPELCLDAGAMPSLATDRWSLAVLLHRLLFGGLDPYFFVAFYADVVDPGVAWPPQPGVAAGKGVSFHKEESKRLGYPVLRLFRSAFNRMNGLARSPALRPSAEDWARTLEVSARWVLRCSRCRETVVALERIRCPFCGARLPHMQVWTQRRCIVVSRDGQSLLGRDVGFTDRGGCYPVVAFSRRGEKVLILPQVPMQDPRRRRDYGPQAPIEVGRGHHTFRLRSRSGRQRAEIRIQVL